MTVPSLGLPSFHEGRCASSSAVLRRAGADPGPHFAGGRAVVPARRHDTLQVEAPFLQYGGDHAPVLQALDAAHRHAFAPEAGDGN